jgi:D-alanine--D-alanine ligase
MMSKKHRLRLAVLCGGPSPERGISLNSARSVCDHLDADDIEILPVYFDSTKRAYAISRGQLYSNTPSDFDFKLHSSGKALSAAQLRTVLRGVDLVFPVMHGLFGEDGGVQTLLEGLGVPFVGSPAAACRRCFDKFDANETIKAHGFHALPSIAINRGEREIGRKIAQFFKRHRLDRAVVKPATGGSSIGVFSVANPGEAERMVEKLFASNFYRRVVVEEFCRGTEFTAVIVQNRFDIPVCLLPVEIEADYTRHQIFDYRKKYLPTRQVTYHCPPRFESRVLERVQSQAEQLFNLFGLRDFARFDGWVMPDERIWFSDFNPISGMEQNSFLFLQAARIGMSHRDMLRFVVAHACQRAGIKFDPIEPPVTRARRERVNVLFGGRTAERQVSVMSGTNVWLKLRRSTRYEPHPYLLDMDGAVWELPYSLTLNHTVEELMAGCRSAAGAERGFQALRERVLNRLAPLPGQISEGNFLPRKMTLSDFVRSSKIVFLGLHGGIGEDGRLQEMLARAGVRFNGSDAKGSRIGMDKYRTGEIVKGLERYGIFSAKRLVVRTAQLRKLGGGDFADLWRRLEQELGGRSFIIKPGADGCSAGIVRIYSARDLAVYVDHLLKRASRLAKDTLTNQGEIVEMPVDLPNALLIEQFIETDRVNVVRNKLTWNHVTGWVEVTVGVVGKKGRMRAMSPSITVASGDVLSVEEKFQGGTGINITPPPSRYVPTRVVEGAKRRIERVAAALGLGGYARIDAFLNIKTGEIYVIEANTLPGLTPSTVIYHQALAEKRPLVPRQFLERILSLA